MFQKLKRLNVWASVPIFVMVVALYYPTQAEAQQHYESAQENYSFGNSNFGANLDLFAEFEQNPSLVRAYGQVEAGANFFTISFPIINSHVLSEVDNGVSTEEVSLELFGVINPPWGNSTNTSSWNWSVNVVTPLASPIQYSFPLVWGLSVDIGCELESTIYAGIQIGVAPFMAAGLDGSVGTKVEVDIYAALSVNLIALKAQVALVAGFTLFDYSVNMDATVSMHSAHVKVWTSFKPFSVTIKLVLRYKTKYCKIKIWPPSIKWYWTAWKVKKTWTLWSWSTPSWNHNILTWHKHWCKCWFFKKNKDQSIQEVANADLQDREKVPFEGKEDSRMSDRKERMAKPKSRCQEKEVCSRFGK